MCLLTLTYEPDDDYMGLLRASVEADPFCGKGSFWVTEAEILEFAEELTAYPLPRIRKLWGYEECIGDDLAIGIEIRPADSVGNLLVEIETAEYSKRRYRVRAGFSTNYPDIERFSRELISLAKRERAQATLTGR